MASQAVAVDIRAADARTTPLPRTTVLRRLATWQSAVMATYAGLLSFAIAQHAYWADEVQAWLIAKDASFWDMFAHVMRYEGNPGLWHLLLWVPARVGAPMVTLSVVTAVIAIAGVALLVYRSPFPAWARALLPFTYFLFFQYGVIARPYCLLPLATCAIALTWEQRMARPYRLAAALTLMSFIAVDGLLVAAALAAVHAMAVWRSWAILPAADRKRQLRAGLGIAMVFALIVAILWPPPDSSFNIVETFALRHATRVLTMPAGAFAGAWLTVPVLAASAFFLHARGQLRLFIFPAVAVLIFFVAKVGEPWQDGFLFFPWLLAMWIAWTSVPLRSRAVQRRWSLVASGVLACVIGVQVYWAAAAVISSTRLPYSSLPATAAYLQAQGLTNGVVYGYGFHGFLVNGYTGRNIFANMNAGGSPDFYPWTTDQKRHETPASVGAGIPDVVVIAVQQVTTRRQVPVVPLPGYVRVAYFSGSLIWEDGVYERDDLLIARRADFRPHTAYGGTCPTYCGPPTSSSATNDN